MAHILSHALVLVPEDDALPTVTIRSSHNLAEIEQLDSELSAAGIYAELRTTVVQFDEQWQVTQLMGSSMGDLEITDVREHSDGKMRWRHVLRTRARDGNLPGAPLAELFWTAARPSSDSEFAWRLTHEGIQYVLGNCGVHEHIASHLQQMGQQLRIAEVVS